MVQHVLLPDQNYISLIKILSFFQGNAPLWNPIHVAFCQGHTETTMIFRTQVIYSIGFGNERRQTLQFKSHVTLTSS